MQTDDGGATWRTTGTPGFYLGSVFSVSGPDVLWSGTQGDAGPVERPVLDVSRDGGRTWADARLPGLVGSQYATNTVLAPPAWFGATGVVAVSHEPTSGQELTIYRSTDHGRTWKRASSSPNPSGGSAFAAVDATHWLVATGTGWHRTADSGRTWASFTPKGLPRAGHSSVELSDADHGVALVATGAFTTPSDLFVTVDGGTTWTAASTN